MQLLSLLNDTDLSTDSFDPIILAEYYLLGQGGSLNAIAKEATGVSFQGIQSTVTTTIANTIAVSQTADFATAAATAVATAAAKMIMASCVPVHALVPDLKRRDQPELCCFCTVGYA